MKKPENERSVTRSFNKVNQRGDENLKSDGMANGTSQGATDNRWNHNQHAGKQDPNKDFNFGRAATNLVGNTGRTANEGPKQPPASRLPNFEAARKAAHMGTLNVGRQERNPGGTRSWEPSATENFRGNYDKITEGRGPTKGNKQ